MSAASWGLVVPAKGDPITPFRTPFSALAESVATQLDKLSTYGFPRYAKRSDLPSKDVVPRQHATVYADPTAANNGDYYWNGTSWVLIMPQTVNGTAAINTSSNGLQTVSHGLGRTPSRVFLQPYGPRSAADSSPRVTDRDSDSFTIVWYYNSGLWTSQSGTGHGCYWKAEG